MTTQSPMIRRDFLKGLGLSVGALALLGSYPLLIERQWLEVNRYRVPIATLPSNFQGFTLLQLTDLHLGPLVSSEYIEGVVKQANLLKPDLIVCTGDYVHERNTTEEIDQVWPILAKLRARHGVYSVLGNHDHWADTGRSQYWLDRTGQNLRHRCQAIERGNQRILIGGTGDFWEDRAPLDQSFSCSDQNDCRILLAHNPDSVDTRFDIPIDLVLSGHTHGGQVVLPFFGPPVLPVRNKRYASGLIDTGKTRLFISRGIGWAILPVRFNCRPEIALLELVNSRARA